MGVIEQCLHKGGLGLLESTHSAGFCFRLARCSQQPPVYTQPIVVLGGIYLRSGAANNRY